MCEFGDDFVVQSMFHPTDFNVFALSRLLRQEAFNYYVPMNSSGMKGIVLSKSVEVL